jgi:glutamyl/glutaminyl-tRNA synthetase
MFQYIHQKNVVNWNYARSASGRFYLNMLMVVEDINTEKSNNKSIHRRNYKHI